MPDLVGNIIAFENGDLSHEEEVALFQGLLDNGTIWHLQGMYQRHLEDLLQSGEVIAKEENGFPWSAS